MALEYCTRCIAVCQFYDLSGCHIGNGTSCTSCNSGCNSCQVDCNTAQTKYSCVFLSDLFGSRFAFDPSPSNSSTVMGPNAGQFNKETWDSIIDYYNNEVALADEYSLLTQASKSTTDAVSPFTAAEFNRVASIVGAKRRVNSGDIIKGSYFSELEDAVSTTKFREKTCNTCDASCDGGCDGCEVSCNTSCVSGNRTCAICVNCNQCNRNCASCDSAQQCEWDCEVGDGPISSTCCSGDSSCSICDVCDASWE